MKNMAVRWLTGRVSPFACVTLGASALALGCSSEGAFETGSQSQRIVGGSEADEGAWPSMVSIAYDLSPGIENHWCGGTLIRPNKVLSAAHCFDDTTASRYQIRIGRHDLTTGDGEEADVTSIQKHPSYSGGDNDLVILTLAESIDDVPLTRLVNEARMSEIHTGDDVTMVGWGDTTAGGTGSETLQEVSLGIIGVGDDCNSVSDYDDVTNNEICIGRLDGGQDTCQGDSGGPAFVRRDGEWFQLGITSWGWGCAEVDRPGVYTYLPEYFDWSLDNVSGLAPSWLPSAQIMSILG